MTLFKENDLQKWVVDLYVSAPVKLSRSGEVRFTHRKDFDSTDPLFSNIVIREESYNNRYERVNFLEIKANAFAPTSGLAKRAAYVFVGFAMDCLAVHTGCPFQISLSKNSLNLSSEFSEKRELGQDEFREAFSESRLLRFTDPTFLRAFGWYNKGLYSVDPLDQFLSLWVALEIVAGKYHTKNEKTEQGIKNQICQCFLDLWGSTDDWKLINGNENWINTYYSTRQKIAHGLLPIDLVLIENVEEKAFFLKSFVREFLIDWRINNLDPESKITDDIQEKLRSEEWFAADH